MIPVNEIVCGHNVDVLAGFPAECIDLTVTSPPYDNLRTYKGFAFDFEGIAQQLYRVTKQGGVVVWVVYSGTKDFNKSTTPYEQVVYFKKSIGFNLLDTMIYAKSNYAQHFDTRRTYAQAHEMMFVLSKGTPTTFNPIKDKPNKWANTKTSPTRRNADGSLSTTGQGVVINDFGIRTNIWTYSSGEGKTTTDEYAFEHPAMFPEKLAQDHILSWSNPDDIVLDPFVGSGTTAKMAIRHHRQYIGIDVSAEYCELARRRIAAVQPTLFDVVAV